MERTSQPTSLVVIDGIECRIVKKISDDTATSILALLSDDPSNWPEAISIWPRVQTKHLRLLPKDLALLPLRRDEVTQELQASAAWIAIDFNSKRIFTGGEFEKIRRDEELVMGKDERGNDDGFVAIHLPPWWELHCDCNPHEIDLPRENPPKKSIVNREVLYGEPLFRSIAKLVFHHATSARWEQKNAGRNKRERYPFTVAVHRDWLMTPRDDLDGQVPRELLHGAIHWSDRVTHFQEIRYENGEPLVAVPKDWIGYSTAPMGSQELCIYFAYCREVIEAGWNWCNSNEGKYVIKKNKDVIPRLARYLARIATRWLDSSFDEGSSPNFIIECDRRRVPRGANTPIQGIDGVEPSPHILDCSCPLCLMMAEGVFGTQFNHLDGHMLDLDDDFVFSMYETEKEWEENSYCLPAFFPGDEWADDLDDDETSPYFDSADNSFFDSTKRNFLQMFSKYDEEEDDIDEDNNEDQIHAVNQAHAMNQAHAEQSTNSNRSRLNPFESSWIGVESSRPIPGDRQGFVKLAFMLTEIIGILKCHDDSQHAIEELNQAFSAYRKSRAENHISTATALKQSLEMLGNRYPVLISKSADLQSHIDETTRTNFATQDG
jgi:hypothetical protein